MVPRHCVRGGCDEDRRVITWTRPRSYRPVVVSVTAALLVALATVAAVPSVARFADAGAVVNVLGTAEPVPVLLRGGVDAGDAWSLGWEADGRLYSWGADARGELGQGAGGGAVPSPGPVALPEGQRVREAAAGINLGIALTEDGGVWTWGNPDIGGNTATPQRLAFFDELLEQHGDAVAGVDAGGYYYLAWTEGGALYSWGNATSRLGRPAAGAQQPGRVTAQGLDGRTVSTASAGRFHGAAVTGGEVVVWGEGNGDRAGRAVDPPVPGGVLTVAAGTRHTLLVAADGSLWSTAGAVTATRVAGLDGVVGASISSPVQGESSFWAWDAAGGLWAWGANETGLLGLGVTGGSVASPTPVPLPPDVAGSPTSPRVAGGATHALYDSGAGVFAAAGDNASGQLGDGTTLGRTTFQVTIPVARWP